MAPRGKARMGRDSGPNYRPVIIVLIVFVVGYLFWPSTPKAASTINYGLMFDAGSTGSRVHVYSFDAQTGKLLDEIFQEVKPGLSAYPDDPEAAARSLQPLLDTSLAKIPKRLHHCTPLALKATAGLRRLGAAKSDAILQAVDKWLRGFGFNMGPRAVEIMGGAEEGVFAWITVNQLLGKFSDSNTSPTVSIMDLGGGSTQIVFEAKDISSVPKAQTYTLPMGSKTYKLFQTSYEGYGLMAARELMAEAMQQDEEGSHDCLPTGVHTDIKVKGSEVAFTGSQDAGPEACLRLAQKILHKEAACQLSPCSINGVHQPDIADTNVFDGQMYAFSYFYDKTQLFYQGGREVLSMVEIKRLLDKACRDMSPSDPMLCGDLSFIYALLSTGYGLEPGQQLHIAKKIDGFETAWALGAMVTLMKNSDLQC